jgi:hypothetical protein
MIGPPDGKSRGRAEKKPAFLLKAGGLFETIGAKR